MSRVRAVLYAGDEQAHSTGAEQLERCRELCDRKGYVVVGIAQDKPGSSCAWEDAQRMVFDGVADRVVFAGPVHLPLYLESASSAWVGHPGGPADRRTEPVRRHDSAAAVSDQGRRSQPVRRGERVR